MRICDLKKIDRLIATLEAGKTPTPEEIKAAREAIDRENAILLKRHNQQQVNLAQGFYKWAP